MKENKRKRILLPAVCAVILFAAALWTAWSNQALEVNRYDLSAENLPDAFRGYRIAHVSDLHNAQIGENNEKLLQMIRESEPDLIAITGDLIDSRKTDVAIALEFAEKAMEIAPCYYVTGNHEARTDEYEKLKQGLVQLGVVILENTSVEIEQENERIRITGVDDPSFQTDYLFGETETVMEFQLQELTEKDGLFTVLLSHRPELFDIYVENGMELVLTGHAHGGQFRLPFVGGLVAPNQGLFPEYDAGIYEKGKTAMIVSRGIGNSVIPFRINNRPEVILIVLK